MQSFITRRESYFKSRFPGDEGITGSILQQSAPRTPTSIMVDHNDYLCIAEQLNQYRRSAGSGRDAGVTMSGIFLEDGGDYGSSTIDLYQRVRQEIADLVQMPACAITQSGMNANVNVVQTLYSKGTPIYVDRKAHASFWLGINSVNAQADSHIFKHNDAKHLAELTAKHGPGIVLIESVYSTCGSFGPVEEIAKLRDSEGHVLVVDESHSLGLYGKDGAGYCHMLGVKADFLTASLSKAVSVRAGIMCASHAGLRYMDARRTLRYTAETALPAIFSSVVEPHDIEVIGESFRVLKSSSEKRDQIMTISSTIRQEVLGLYGIEATPHPSPIFGFTFKTELETDRFQRYLQQNGVFGSVFCRPATPKNASLVRLTINSSVGREQAEQIVKLVKEYVGIAKL